MGDITNILSRYHFKHHQTTMSRKASLSAIEFIRITLAFIFTVVCWIHLNAQRVDSLANPKFYSHMKKARELHEKSLPYQSLVETQKMINASGNDPMLEAVGQYMKGANYTLSGDFEKAYQQLLPALKFFRETDNDFYLPQVYGALAALMTQRGDTEEALEYYQKALAILQRTESTEQTYRVQGNIGIVHAKNGDLNRALEIFKEVERKALSRGDTNDVIPAYLNISLAYLHLGKTDSAETILDKAIEMSIKKGKMLELANAKYSLSSLLLSRGDYQKAVRESKEALKNYKEVGIYRSAPQILNQIAESYNKMGKPDSAYLYMRELKTLRDSLFNSEKERAVAEAEGKFFLTEKENEIKLLEAQNKVEQNKRWLFVLLFALALAIGIAIFIRMKNIGKMRKAESRVHDKQMELEKAQKLKLKSELDMKVRSLTTEGLRIIQKNQQLEELQEKLEKLDRAIPDNSRSELQDIRSSLKFAFSTDRDWKEFSVYFEDVHPSFLDALHSFSPNLTTKEKRLSSLIRVGMSTKEIASVLGISPDSVKKARNRLRKKLDLDATQDLNNFLERMELINVS